MDRYLTRVPCGHPEMRFGGYMLAAGTYRAIITARPNQMWRLELEYLTDDWHPLATHDLRTRSLSDAEIVARQSLRVLTNPNALLLTAA